jgi:hypothetical protein
MTQVINNVFGSVGQKEEVKQSPNDRLKSLIELGSIKDSKVLGGQKFNLKTPSLVERTRMSSYLSGKAEVTQQEMVDFQVNILAHVIVSVDGIPLEDLHPEKEMDSLQRRVEIVSTFQGPLITSLIDLYKDMLNRCDAQFGSDEIKK